MKKWERIEIRNNIDEIELTIDSIVVFRFFKINLVNYPVIKGYILDFIGGKEEAGDIINIMPVCRHPFSPLASSP
jgi:hypothetical protein